MSICVGGKLILLTVMTTILSILTLLIFRSSRFRDPYLKKTVHLINVSDEGHIKPAIQIHQVKVAKLN